MKDVEAMAVVVNPTVKSLSPQRHVLAKSRKGADVHAKNQDAQQHFAAVGWGY